MKEYTFDKSSTGIYGYALEMAIKDALKRRYPDDVSPVGREDLRYKCKNYDVKQNGTVLQYDPKWGYVRGSNQVIYATHISYSIVRENAETVTLTVDLLNTELFVVDKKEFIEFLKSINGMKYNAERQTVNVQTCYNYKKGTYHGKKGKLIEAWARENGIVDDTIVQDIKNAVINSGF